MRHLVATPSVIVLLSCPLQAKDKKKEPDEIGNRDVGKGVNFYSLEKEIARGESLAAGSEPVAGKRTGTEKRSQEPAHLREIGRDNC